MSPLWQVRNDFIERSGRYDLGVIGDQDTAENTGTVGIAGADRFINEGQRFLDMQVIVPTAERRWMKKVPSGTFHLTPLGLRTVLEVHAIDSEGERCVLEKKRLSELLDLYSGPFADAEGGVPLYWAINDGRLSPEHWDQSDGSFVDEVTEQDSDDFLYETCGETSSERYGSIIIMPPTDGDYTIRLRGRFFSPALTDNCSTSYWTEQFPEMLVDAAIYRLESFLRNTQGMNDAMGALAPMLRKIDHDVAAQALVGKTMLEG